MSWPVSLPHAPSEKLHALEELVELSKPSIDFFVLLAGSMIIASLGLFENSSAVIIGTMIVAPLRRLLLELSFASITADVVALRCYCTLKQPTDVIASAYDSKSDFNSKQVRSLQDFLIRQTGIPVEFHLRIIPLKEVNAIECTPSGSNDLSTPSAPKPPGLSEAAVDMNSNYSSLEIDK